MVKYLIFGALALAWLAFEAQKRRSKTLTQQDSISSAAATIRDQDSVIHSAVSALALVHSLYAAAIAQLKSANPGLDTSDLDAATAEAKASTADLAQAIAINTPASDEVHEDDGGTGTNETVVDPADVDTSAVTAPVDAAAGASGDGGGAAS